MIETMAKAAEVTLNSPERSGEQKAFDPEKRIEPGVKGEEVSESGKYDPDKRITEIKPDADGFYTRLADRIKYSPLEASERGDWTGERGNSIFIPKYPYMKDVLKRFGIEGIRYKNGEAYFSPVAEATVQIDKMTENRLGKEGNYDQADAKLAEKFNEIRKDGLTNWDAGSVAAYRKAHKLTWHERCDLKTMDLVPTKIHTYFRHSGGVAEYKAKNGIGGKFDE